MENDTFWLDAELASLRGNLSAFLDKIPRQDWTKRDRNGTNLLMMSTRYSSDNISAFWKLLPLFNLNDSTTNGWSVVHFASTSCPLKLEILCALEVNVQLETFQGLTPLDRALFHKCTTCAKVLIANGSRTSNTRDSFTLLDSGYLIQRNISQDLLDFEKGIISCRNVIVVLLGLKKYRRVAMLPKLDRFLVKQILAVEIWSTRSCDNEKWQK